MTVALIVALGGFLMGFDDSVISGVVGFINSTVAFLVTLVFPWQLENLGSANTFLIYGVIAVTGLVFVMRILPETKGRSLEELEQLLVRH